MQDSHRFLRIRRSLHRLVLALPLVTVAPTPVRAQELTFSVAISVKDAIEELGRQFHRMRPGVVLRYNIGSSGELQKQIEAGAPVDLFISAAQRQMDELEKQALILPGSRRVFARNALTVIVPADSRLDLGRPVDLLRPQVHRIVIGSPKTVPAGQYAEESLRMLGLWDGLRPKLVFAENVRQALEYVSRGEVDAGFVYTTDAAVRPGRVRTAFRPPLESYQQVTYPVAVVASSRHPSIAQAFIDLLLGPEGRAVLSRLGFQLPVGSSR